MPSDQMHLEILKSRSLEKKIFKGEQRSKDDNMSYVAHFDHHPGKSSSGKLRFDAKDTISKVEILQDGATTVRGIRDKDGSFGSFPRSYIGKLNKEGNLDCFSCREFSKRLEQREEYINGLELKIAAVADEIYVSCLSRFNGIRKTHVQDQCKITQLQKSISKLQSEIDKLHENEKKNKEQSARKHDEEEETTDEKAIAPRLRSMTRQNSKDGMMSPTKRRLTQRYFDASEEYIRQQANTAMLGWQLNRIEQVSTKRKEKEKEEEKIKQEEEDENQKFASNSASSVTSTSSSAFQANFDSRGNVAFPGTHDSQSTAYASQSTTASSVRFDSSGRMAAFPAASHDSQSSAFSSSASSFRSTGARLYASNASTSSHVSTSSGVLPSAVELRVNSDTLSPRQRATRALARSVLREKKNSDEEQLQRSQADSRRLEDCEARLFATEARWKEDRERLEMEMKQQQDRMNESEARQQDRMNKSEARFQQQQQDRMNSLESRHRNEYTELKSGLLAKHESEMAMMRKQSQVEKADRSDAERVREKEKLRLQYEMEMQKSKSSRLEDTVDQLKISIQRAQMERDALEEKLKIRSNQHENDLDLLEAERRRAAEADLRARVNLETTKNVEFMLHDEYVCYTQKTHDSTHAHLYNYIITKYNRYETRMHDVVRRERDELEELKRKIETTPPPPPPRDDAEILSMKKCEQGLRRELRDAEKHKKHMSTLESRLNVLRNEVRASKTEFRALDDEIENSRSEMISEHRHIATLREELNEEIERSGSNITLLREELKESRRKLALATSQGDIWKKNLDASREKVNREMESSKRRAQDLDDARRARDRVEAELKTMRSIEQDTVALLKTQLREQHDEFETQLRMDKKSSENMERSFLRNVKSFENRVETLQGELETCRAKMNRENESAQRQSDDLDDTRRARDRVEAELESMRSIEHETVEMLRSQLKDQHDEFETQLRMDKKSSETTERSFLRNVKSFEYRIERLNRDLSSCRSSLSLEKESAQRRAQDLDDAKRARDRIEVELDVLRTSERDAMETLQNRMKDHEREHDERLKSAMHEEQERLRSQQQSQHHVSREVKDCILNMEEKSRREYEARESEWEGRLAKEAESRTRVEQVAKQLRISLNDITEQCAALRTFW